MTIRRFDKLPRRKVTVSEVIRSEAWRDITDAMETEAEEIVHVMTIYTKKDGTYSFRATGIAVMEANWLFDCVKHSLLHEAKE